MKSHPLGRYLRARRTALGLSQDTVARAVGVTRACVGRYENEQREIPVAMLDGLARLLETDPAVLETLRTGAPRAVVSAVRERAPLTPLTGHLSAVAGLPSLRSLHDEVREALGPGRCDDLECCFLRQTPWEMAVAFHVIANNGEMIWTSPLEAGSRVLVAGEDKRSYEGHLLRLAISWEHDDERVLLFPQVPIVVPRLEYRYRVDYLAVHLVSGRPAANVIVELDGAPHKFQRVQDEVRAEDLRLPLIRLDNYAVHESGFFPHLLRGIQDKAAAARISNGEFARFIRARRERYEQSTA